MPWKDTCPMEERKKFISEWLEKDWSLTDLCEYYDVSRKTAYKWIERYKQTGLAGLEDLSRAPDRHPNATTKEIEDMVLAFRRKRPSWGPKKILDRLENRFPDVDWPCISTAGEILKRNGLVKPRRRVRKTAPFNQPMKKGLQPNNVWATDFKGWFCTGDRTRIDPLTVTDWASRYLLKCHGMVGVSTEKVKEQFELLFREFGLPDAIRNDNGAPFASTAPAGISRLSAWWIRLGIQPERIRPGHPEENGRHERMHRTLKDETARPPKENVQRQQAAFDAFLKDFNEERPHEALGMKTPGECYWASSRPFPNRLPEMDYGREFEVRRVRSCGSVKMSGTMFFLTEVLTGELVGLKQTEEDRWSVYFGPHLLGTFHEETETFKKV
jgi:putative transposase